MTVEFHFECDCCGLDKPFGIANNPIGDFTWVICAECEALIPDLDSEEDVWRQLIDFI